MNTFELCLRIRTLIVNKAAEVMCYVNLSDEQCSKLLREIPAAVKASGHYYNINPGNLTKDQMTQLGFMKWADELDLMLIPLWLHPFMSSDLEVLYMEGEKGKLGECDLDNRMGLLACGVNPSDLPQVTALIPKGPQQPALFTGEGL